MTKTSRFGVAFSLMNSCSTMRIWFNDNDGMVLFVCVLCVCRERDESRSALAKQRNDVSALLLLLLLLQVVVPLLLMLLPRRSERGRRSRSFSAEDSSHGGSPCSLPRVARHCMTFETDGEFARARARASKQLRQPPRPRALCH
jgi:hypothetical protein